VPVPGAAAASNAPVPGTAAASTAPVPGDGTERYEFILQN